MKTLKLALIATSAAGAVAAAGGVTYATVGHSSPAPSVRAAKDGAVAKAARSHGAAVRSVPAVPTCLPKPPKGKLPAAPDGLPHAPGALPKPSAEPQGVPGNQPHTLPKAQNLPQPPKVGNLPKAGDRPTLPAKPPVCEPDSASAPAPAHVPAVPGPPTMPSVPSCASVPPVIKVQDARAKDVTLPNGAHLAFAHAHSVIIGTRRVCAITQRFVTTAGGFVSVERVNTPPRATLSELARALKLSAGDVVSAGGVDAWRNPANTGMLWYSHKGGAIYLSASPEYSALLPGVAAQLRTE